MFYKLDWKQNGKGYLASRAGNFDASTVLLDNRFCNREAQSVVMILTIPCFINAIKTVKEMLQLFRWNLFTVIGNAENGVMRLPL